MLALYHSERQADALATFTRAREALESELGLEPGAELQQLQIAILRHEVPPVADADAGGRHNLPAQLASFVGRQDELDDLAQLMGENRLVTLTGVGGVGKTRLALEAAERAFADFADGAWFVDLAPLGEPALVAQHVARTLQVREAGGDAVTSLVERLRQTETLL